MVALSTLGIASCGGLLSGSRQLPPPDHRYLRRVADHRLVIAASTHKQRPPLLPAVRAVALESNQGASPQPPDEGKPTTYHFLVANAKFMLDEEEHFREQLYERLRLFKERNMEQDFWLAIEPKFLDKFPSLTKRLKRPAVALVSTDGTWIRFMKLRLDRVLMENFEANSPEEALASNPADLSFEKPATWTAPYPKYEFGWWEPFLLPKA